MKGHRRKLTGAALTAAALALGVAGSAHAAPYPPQALGVDTEGNAYAGLDGVVKVLSPSGALLRQWGSSGDAPGQISGGIAAISVDPQNRVWTLDGANRVQEFTRDGVYQRGFTLSPCTEPAETWSRGGLDVSSAYVFATSVCSDEVVRLDKATLAGRRSVTLDNPDGISYNQYASCGYRVAVAGHGSKEVTLYDTDLDRVGSRVIGGRVPDVYLDDFGVVFASDIDSHTVRLIGCDGVEFRTLGGFGSAPGKLDNALAIDVFGQYGGDLAGNVFVGEYSNARVQRWSSGGYTFYATPLDTTSTPGPTPTPTPDPTPTPTPTPTPDPGTGAGRPVGVTIEFHAAYVNSRDVELRISPPAGATSVLISNDGGFDFAEQRPIAADQRYAWRLPVSGLAERLPRTVYVRFPGSANPTQTYTDDIVLDTTAPAVRTVSLRGTTLRVSARDAVSGVGFVQVATGTTARSRRLTARYGKAVKVSRKLGRRPYVRVVDRAGNAGRWVRVRRR
ncbi:hypothetical protein [Paraconexibacter algicola]|uniref:Uncharacterized protein n=1 Tax=Paraconexibacter algicola TaxID=2133960 RepID=A0A2T4UF22_9ACTN|nr:hypothetical protein [Paraconexibacter algicola]PTL56393.1 hypothetical protein C7Y72_15635 [Paraconexibacter algicola]